MVEDKSIDQRLRRAARRQGLRLEKSKLRDPRARDYGTYQLVNSKTGKLAHGNRKGGYGLSLAAVAEILGVPPE